MKTAGGKERKLARNTQALLAEYKKANIGDYLIRAKQALEKDDIDVAAAAVAALTNLNRGVYDGRRAEAFRTAKTYFRYGNSLFETIKRNTNSPVVWDYLQPYLEVADIKP